MLIAAGCGTTHATSTATPQTTAGPATTTQTSVTADPVADRADVTTAWTTFFNGSTAVPAREALVENASAFASILATLANNPLASKTKAIVSSVTLSGANTARVTFTVTLAGAQVLKDAHGTAIRTSSGWKVSHQSFCALLALVGETPSACAAG